MRLLVFSDSHRVSGFMRNAIFDHPEADAVIFLGDGERDFESVEDMIQEKRIIKVCGNCDFGSSLPVNQLVEFAGVKVFCSHGHAEQVKFGDEMLLEKAKSLGARIALYGHTHKAVTDYRDGLYLMNPGSVAYGNYGIVDITPKGIICINASL